jgi:hypothetical protein
MLEEGSTPIQVAIALDLREKEVSELYREWWNLNRLYQLNQVYEELANDIWSIAELNRRRKAEGLSIQQVSRILKRITTLERQTIDMEREQTRLEVNNKYAATTFQQFTDSIQRDRKTMNENEYIINKQKMEINRLSTEKARLETTVENAKLELLKIRLENFEKYFRNNNIEYNNVKQAIEGEVEYVLADRRRLLRMAIQSVIELLRLNPQKFHSYYYNRSTIQLETEEPILIEAEKLYEKMLENITNKVVTDLSDNISSMSSLAQKESLEESSIDILTSSDYLDAKEESTLPAPEDKGMKRNSFNERPDVPAVGHRMISFPYRGQAWHPNFDAEV